MGVLPEVGKRRAQYNKALRRLRLGDCMLPPSSFFQKPLRKRLFSIYRAPQPYANCQPTVQADCSHQPPESPPLQSLRPFPSALDPAVRQTAPASARGSACAGRGFSHQNQSQSTRPATAITAKNTRENISAPARKSTPTMAVSTCATGPSWLPSGGIKVDIHHLFLFRPSPFRRLFW